MRVAIFGRTAGEKRLESIRRLYASLIEKNARPVIYEPFLKLTRDLLPKNVISDTFKNHIELQQKSDCLISIGGDGTLLEATTFVRNSGLPVIGINTGRLGFLTGFASHEIETACEMIISNQLRLESRNLIQMDTDIDYFGEIPFALNEVTFHKRDSSSMITLHVKMNGNHINSYWGDGLIISTPTGSTGYSLSCGGPIMMPDSHNLIITPIAPHNLNVRPLVIPDSVELSVNAEVRGKNFMVSLDSRSAIFPAGENIQIRKADFTIQLARKPERDFPKTLREKLMWGIDKRN